MSTEIVITEEAVQKALYILTLYKDEFADPYWGMADSHMSGELGVNGIPVSGEAMLAELAKRGYLYVWTSHKDGTPIRYKLLKMPKRKPVYRYE